MKIFKFQSIFRQVARFLLRMEEARLERAVSVLGHLRQIKWGRLGGHHGIGWTAGDANSVALPLRGPAVAYTQGRVSIDVAGTEGSGPHDLVLRLEAADGGIFGLLLQRALWPDEHLRHPVLNSPFLLKITVKKINTLNFFFLIPIPKCGTKTNGFFAKYWVLYNDLFHNKFPAVSTKVHNPPITQTHNI